MITLDGSPDRDGGKREIVQAAARLFLERDRVGLIGVSPAALLTTSDFDAERVFRFRVGFGSLPVETVAEPALASIF
jgi:hypothetical protein